MSGSTWTWVGNTSDPTIASNWQLTSGPGNGQNQPQDGDTAIIPGGTPAQPVLLDSTLGSNFLELLGNASLEFANDTGIAASSGVDSQSVISATGTATTLTVVGAFSNFGMIAANGPSGSNTTIDIQANLIPQGVSTLTLPGYAINYDLIEVDIGNTMTITIGPNAELFNVGEIMVDGGSLFIQADASAIAGGYAPVAGAAVISGGGTIETNVAYASTVSGVTPTYAFSDATAGNTLKIDNIGSFGGQILGFGAGDTIDIANLATAAITHAVYSQTTGILNLEDASNTIKASLFLTSGNFSNASFSINNVGSDVVVTTTVPNFISSNTTGNWQDSGSWVNGSMPGPLDTALVGTGFSAPFTLSTGGTAVTVGALTIGNDGETLLINSNTTVEPYTINQFGGSIEVASGSTLTTSALRMYGGSTLIDAGAGLKLTGRQTAGLAANNGTITISNSNTIALRVSNGTLTVNGGTVDATPNAASGGAGGGGNIFIGVDGGGMPGAMIVQGSSGTAAVVTDTYTELSSDPTSFGILTLNGNVTWSDKIDQHETGTATSTGSMIVGTNNESSNSGALSPAPFTNAATLLVENGAILNEALSAQIGATTNSAGTATIETGGIWNVGSNGLGVGFNGSGSLSILSGGTVSTNSGGGVAVGSALATADGTITVSDAGSLLKTSGGMSVGKLGHGVLNIVNGGTVEVLAGAKGMTAGSSGSAVGTISISGTDAGNGKHAELLFDTGSSGLTIGGAGQGTLSVGTNGTIQINGTSGIFIGQSGSGSVSVSGGGALINLGSTATGITVGQGGTGTLSVGSGGTISLNGTSGIGVGQSAGAVGLVTVSGSGAVINTGTTASGMTIGQGGTGTLQVLNGGHVTIAAKNLGIGTSFNNGTTVAVGTGTVTVDGKGSSIVTQGTTGTLVGNINIGSPGTGVLNVSNGGSVGVSGGVFIGSGGGTSTGTVTVNGGTLTAAAGIGVGNNGIGTLTVSGGGIVTNTGSNSFNIGFGAGTSGTVVINSGTVSNTAGLFSVGGTSASGTLQVNKGGSLITGGSTILSVINATGTGAAAATISGGSWTVNGQMNVGDAGSGSLNINSSGLVNAGTNFVNIGNQTGGNGTIAVSGGTLEANSVAVGNSFGGTGKGTLAVSANGLVQVTSLSEAGGSNIDVTGGTITTGAANLGQSGTTAVLTIGTLGTVSQSGNAFNIGTGASASASVVVNTGGSLSTNNLLIGGGPNGSDGTLTVNGGQVSNTGGFTIGQTGSGTLVVQNGGSVVTNSGTFFTAMSVAGAHGALVSINSGQVSLLGGAINLGGSNASGSLSVGSSGTLITGGTAIEEINATGTGTASATISGSWTSGGQITVGDSGNGSLDINGGVVNTGTNSVRIGNQSTSSGTVSVESGGTLIADSVGVGDPFSGTANAVLNVGSAGVVQVNSLGQSGGSISVVGGHVTSTGFINIGQTAASAITTIGSLGVMSETGAGAGINIGSGNGGNGTVTVDAGGTLSAAGFLEVGGNITGGNGVLTVNGGVVTAGNGIFVGGPAPGTITINGDGSVSNSGTNGVLIGASNGSGAIAVNSGTLTDTGPTTTIGDQFNSTGTLTVGATGHVSLAALLVGTGGVIHMAGGNLSAGGVSTMNGSIDGFGTLTAGLNNASTVTANGGALVITRGISGTGAMNIDGGATLEIGGALGGAQSVTFVTSASAEALQLDDLTSTGFGLFNWQNGDELFIANGVTVTGANWLGGSGTLEVDTTGGIFDFTNVTLAAGTTPVFATGSNFVELVSCFVTGTRISTERGEVAVEDLCEGDRVQLVLGRRTEPVVWIGQRRVDCARHPEPRRVWPVRIAAGAFGQGRPSRDLWLSPDHAVFVGDVLIPVKHLINGSTIAQVPMDQVTYFHVELPEHSVLLAEGLAVESYLDTGDRSNFINGGGPIALYPDFVSRAWDAQGCAPLVVTGAEVEAARRWVNGLAASAVPATSAA